MCGIAGCCALEGQGPVSPQLARAMTRALAHRGPDDEGFADFPQVALGHRRLSILDLAGGHQPLCNEDSTVWIVYNGELYNFPELRRELEPRHQFRTNSDTEVLVHLYEEEGPEMLKRLNGMFAFALYDQRRDHLLLARDRFGVKPLFYAQRKDGLYFASEIKALKLLPDFDATLDYQALSTYLSLYFIPEPWTAYKSIRRLRAGHYLLATPEGVREGEYYDLNPGRGRGMPQAQAEEETARLFSQAVRRQLISDVPVGVLLSGGMDSRLILAAGKQAQPDLRSFTIAFNEKAFDESAEAAILARLYQSPHQTMPFALEDLRANLVGRQRHLDEPFASWSNVAVGEMARFINRNGYKVVLSGAGGDELFFGYPTAQAIELARWYQLLPAALRRKVALPLVRRLPGGSGRLPLSFKLKSFAEADDPDPLRNYFGLKEVIRAGERPTLLTPEAWRLIGQHDPLAAYDQYRPRIGQWPLLDQVAYLDFKVFLQGCILNVNDNAYMAASVEQRVPFLDNDLVDFALGLPLAQRFNFWRTKWLLRQAASRFFPLPASPAGEAPPAYRKNGFLVPINDWMQSGPGAKVVRALLSPQRVARTGFFRPDQVERMISEQAAKVDNHDRMLQVMISLVLFLEGDYDCQDL